MRCEPKISIKKGSSSIHPLRGAPRQQENYSAVSDVLPRGPCSPCDSFSQPNEFSLPQHEVLKCQIYLIICIFNCIHPTRYTFSLTVLCCLEYKFPLHNLGASRACQLLALSRGVRLGSESGLPNRTSALLPPWWIGGDSAVSSLHLEPFFTIQKNSSNWKWLPNHRVKRVSVCLLSTPHLQHTPCPDLLLWCFTKMSFFSSEWSLNFITGQFLTSDFFFLSDKTDRDLERKVGSDTQLGSPLFPSLRKTFIEHLQYGMEIKDIIPTLKVLLGWWR